MLEKLKNSLRIELEDDTQDTLLNLYLSAAKSYVINAIGYEPDPENELYEIAVLLVAIFFFQNPDISQQKDSSRYADSFISLSGIFNQLRGSNATKQTK